MNENTEYKLTLTDVNYDDRKITFLVNDKTHMHCTFEFIEDINRYIQKDWDWKPKTVIEK